MKKKAAKKITKPRTKLRKATPPPPLSREIEWLQDVNRELKHQLKRISDARDFYAAPRDDYKALLEQERLHLIELREKIRADVLDVLACVRPKGAGP